MKLSKTIKTTTVIAFAAFTYFTLASSSGGFSSANYTGAKGSSAGCSCHTSNTPATNITFELDSAGVPVTQYVGGMSYTLKVKGTNSSNLPYYGFELAIVKGSGSAQTQAGTWGTVTTPAGKTQTRTMSTLSIIEHNQPIAITAATNTYDIVVPWTAPAAGAGTVSVYCTLNAVNGTGGTGGDAPNNKSVSFTEETVVPNSVNNVSANLAVTVYPNPTHSSLNINLQNANNDAYTLQVFDMSGKLLHNEAFNASGNYTHIINTQTFANGMYLLQLSNATQQFKQSFIKN
jgi:hypothetical protein